MLLEQCESNTLYTNERVPSRVAEEKVLKTEINKLRGELQVDHKIYHREANLYFQCVQLMI